MCAGAEAKAVDAMKARGTGVLLLIVATDRSGKPTTTRRSTVADYEITRAEEAHERQGHSRPHQHLRR